MHILTAQIIVLIRKLFLKLQTFIWTNVYHTWYCSFWISLLCKFKKSIDTILYANTIDILEMVNFRYVNLSWISIL